MLEFVNCPFCKERVAAPYNEEVEELVEEKEEGEVLYEADCPNCSKPLKIYTEVTVSVDVNASAKAMLSDTDKRYIQWAKENGKDVSEYENAI